MDTRLLRNFVKIAELGSISRAADVLGIAQPSLSQQLLRLEDEIGCKLFRRTARGVATTEAGEVFLKHARHMVELAQAAIEEIRQIAAMDQAKVVLAMPHSIGRIVAVPLTEAALASQPLIFAARPGGFLRPNTQIAGGRWGGPRAALRCRAA